MKEKKTPKKVERRKFLLQAGGGTLAVGFGAGLTSCASTGGGGGGGSGYLNGWKVTVSFGYSREIAPGLTLNAGLKKVIHDGNSNNNSEEISATYDPLTDTWEIENISQEDFVCATYDLVSIDGDPVDITDLEVILAPGQSFSITEPSENSFVITNTSSNDIDLGDNVVLEPDESLDLNEA